MSAALTSIQSDVDAAFAAVGGPAPRPQRRDVDAELPAAYPVSDLAEAAVGAATAEVARLVGAATGSPAPACAVSRWRAGAWFDMTLRGEGWSPPPALDPLFRPFRAADGWVRMHTVAPHHHAAALRVLGCDAAPEAVERAVAAWPADALETAVIAAGGASARLRDAAAWAAHPQGQAVAAEPLIAWSAVDRPARPLSLDPARPLAGARALDLTRVLAGPVATRFLAAWGADVLRVDPPFWDEPGLEPEVTVGKRCAGLDLRVQADRAAFAALAGRADVIVHGYRADALERLGFGPAWRRAVAPDAVEVALCAYGWSGPWALRRGFDSLVQMSCGVAAHGAVVSGAERPRPLPVQALDHATGYLMAAAAVRGLAARAEGAVLTARLSLARTARLLTDRPRDAIIGAPPPRPPEVTEPTAWGPALRVAFPAELDGAAPVWPAPAGPLRAAPPTFAA